MAINLQSRLELWGGNSSRRYYGEYAQYFNIDKYRELIYVIINSDNSIETIVKHTKKFVEDTPGINISFITKHLRFWQKAYDFNNPLPIYDEMDDDNKELFQKMKEVYISS